MNNLKSAILLFFLFFFANSIYAKKDSTYFNKESYSWERFSITFGGFASALDNSIQLKSKELGLGVVIDVEEALNLNSNISVFRSDGRFNYGKNKRHAVTFAYYGFSRIATKVLEKEIEIGDEIYPIGTTLKSTYSYSIIKAGYNYTFFADERVRIGSSIGLFVMPINFSIQEGNQKTNASNFIAPLPVLGFDANFAVTPKWYFKQSIELFYLQIDNFTGSITDINIRVEYQPWKHIGFGLGYNGNQMKMKIDNNNDSLFSFRGSIESGYNGLQVYAKIFF